MNCVNSTNRSLVPYLRLLRAQDASQAFAAWKKVAGDWRETAGTVLSSESKQLQHVATRTAEEKTD